MAKAKTLIVTADDFGLHPAVTDGILLAHREGIVTATSLLVSGEDAERALRLAAACPGLAVGVHLALSDVRPCLDGSRIPVLASPDGGFRLDFKALSWAAMRHELPLAEIRLELGAQVRRAIDLGLAPRHLDGHRHLHVLPGVFDIALDLCKEFRIPRIRLPRGGYCDVLGAPGMMALEFFARRAAGRIRSRGDSIRTCDFFAGRRYSCRLDKRSLLGILGSLRPGSTELMCHPALASEDLRARFDWTARLHEELEGLRSAEAREAIERHGVELVSGLESME